MRELADGVWHLSGFPPNAINVYVIGDVLIDAGTRLDRRRILKQIEGRTISTHALTHAHFDHYGASHAVCERLGIPLWCGAEDVEAVEAGKMVGPGGRTVPGPHRHPVARALREGDEVAGFTVLEVPGHSPGHVAYWRESDRTLICGDVLWGVNPFTMMGGMREPAPFASPDPVRNRESARRLAELEPALVCFGHGSRCATPKSSPPPWRSCPPTDMGKLIATTQATLDGVIDPVGEWVQPDGDHGEYSFERQARSSGMVLGRKTYEGLAGYWPSKSGKWADMVNALPKYVGSTTLSGDLAWNATLLEGDLEDSIPTLKDEVDGDLFMHGSGEFAYALAEKGLIDTYEIYLNPLVWGKANLHVLGDRGTVRMQLEGVKRFDSGVVLLTYLPALL